MPRAMGLFCIVTTTEIGWDFLRAFGLSSTGNTNRLSFVFCDDCESHNKYRGVALHPRRSVPSGDVKVPCSGTECRILKTAKQIQNYLCSFS